jgi:hypothetical protein
MGGEDFWEPIVHLESGQTQDEGQEVLWYAAQSYDPQSPQ